MLREYNSIIKEQLEADIIEKVVDQEKAEKVHYMPHLAVVRRNAETAKVRVVYDASSKEGKKGTRRVARIFCGGGGAYLNNRDQIINVSNDKLC